MGLDWKRGLFVSLENREREALDSGEEGWRLLWVPVLVLDVQELVRTPEADLS